MGFGCKPARAEHFFKDAAFVLNGINQPAATRGPAGDAYKLTVNTANTSIGIGTENPQAAIDPADGAFILGGDDVTNLTHSISVLHVTAGL
jgi:hypothetical protein